ncbi:MAG: hypothetical protein ACXWJ2_09410, partial [Hyphomicrobium sp.]
MQQFRHAGDEPVAVEALGLQRLATGEGHETLRQLGGVAGSLHGHVDVAVEFGSQLGGTLT